MDMVFVPDAAARLISVPQGVHQALEVRITLRALDASIQGSTVPLPGRLARSLDALFSLFGVREEVVSTEMRRRIDSIKSRQIVESVWSVRDAFEREAEHLNYDLMSACLAIFARFGLGEVRERYLPMLRDLGTKDSQSYAQAARRLGSGGIGHSSTPTESSRFVSKPLPKSREDKHGFVLYLTSAQLHELKKLASENEHSLQKYLVELLAGHVKHANTPAERKKRAKRFQDRLGGQ